MKWALGIVLILTVVFGGLVWWQSNNISKLEAQRQELIRENDLLKDQVAIAEQDRKAIEEKSREEISKLRDDISTLESESSEHIENANRIRTEIVTRYRDVEVEVPVEIPVEFIPEECQLFAAESKELRLAISSMEEQIRLEKQISDELLEGIIAGYQEELNTKNTYIVSLESRIDVTDKQLNTYKLKDKFNLFRPKLVIGAGLAAGYREVQPAIFAGIGWSF